METNLSNRIHGAAILLYEHKEVVFGAVSLFSPVKKFKKTEDFEIFLLKQLSSLGLDDSDVSLKMIESGYVTESTFRKTNICKVFKPPWVKIVWEIISKGKTKFQEETYD